MRSLLFPTPPLVEHLGPTKLARSSPPHPRLGLKKERQEMNTKRPAVTAEQKIYDKCDRLYPQLRHGRCCLACLAAWRVRPADVIHHYIRRANPLTRFELLNLIPLCNACHEKIHAGKLHEPISEEQKDWLTKMANKSLKGICIARGITKEEFFREQYERIKEQVLL